MRTWKVSEPIFKTATLFVVDCSFETFKAYLQRRYRTNAGEDVGQTGQMCTFEKAPPWRCVWSKTKDAPVVLHEVFHLVTRICQDKGVPIVAHIEDGHSGDETAAYLFEFFASAVLKRLK